MTGRVRLGVNIDHVATVRNARGGRHPCVLRAAHAAAAGGADGITVHLREDRRHITDEDVALLLRELSLPLNLEMAPTAEMIDIALRHRPHACCLVPEKRRERTTEGGLDLCSGYDFTSCVRALQGAGIRVSLFIEPELVQVQAAARFGADIVELHTGRYAAGEESLDRLQRAAAAAADAGLEVHAGHGLDFTSAQMIAGLPEMRELNIGHFLVGEAVFIGLEAAVRQMRAALD